jgi:hypothetical protein
MNMRPHHISIRGIDHDHLVEAAPLLGAVYMMGVMAVGLFTVMLLGLISSNM